LLKERFPKGRPDMTSDYKAKVEEIELRAKKEASEMYKSSVNAGHEIVTYENFLIRSFKGRELIIFEADDAIH
jgi:hypothetical protein